MFDRGAEMFGEDGRALSGLRCRASVDADWPVVNQNGPRLRDARPHVPVVNTRDASVEQSDLEKTFPAYQDRRGQHLKIQFQDLPEEVAAARARDGNLSGRNAVLIGEQYGTRDETGFGYRFEQCELVRERVGQPQVVVVEEGDVIARAREQSDVSRTGHALIAFESNVFDAAQPFAHTRRPVSRRV